MTFKSASEFVATMPSDGSVPDSQRLEFYGLYKQATVGDCTGSQPWAIQLEARAKFDAWAKLKGMSKSDAEAKYVELLNRVKPGWSS